jgi:diguanylate cyclase (GGDEF)-like protein
MIYGILLTAGILLCISGLLFIPVDTYMADDKETSIEITPTEMTMPSEDIREFHFRNIDWKEKGNCLHFISSHQEIRVRADDKLIFERRAVQTMWGGTPGFAWEYIEIPESAKEVTVTVTACYPSVREAAMTFYQGASMKMFQRIFHQEGFTAIISFLNICLGVILFLYGSAVHRRTNVGGAMVYLGIFTALLGSWSLSENGIVAILIKNRAGCSFVSYMALALLGIPFLMFVHRYLQTDDKYVRKILLGLNILSILLTFQLQLFEVRDMKQTLWMTHIAMVLSFFYLPFSLVRMIRRHLVNQRFWVTIWSLVSMCPPLVYSLYLYYCGSHNVDSYANVFVFVFIAIFAVDVSRSIMIDIDAGKKAAIYQELAEKDLLTDCYNRNAYRRDTENWLELEDVLLVTCDLNDLKQCNDTLGHSCGDQYIMDAAAMLKKVFDQYGRVYRIGGDEFCIIIPEGRKCSIKKLLSDLTEEEHIYNAGSPVIDLQIACGYAEFDARMDSNMEDIRNRADERMYSNKKELKQLKNRAICGV